MNQRCSQVDKPAGGKGGRTHWRLLLLQVWLRFSRCGGDLSRLSLLREGGVGGGGGGGRSKLPLLTGRPSARGRQRSQGCFTREPGLVGGGTASFELTKSLRKPWTWASAELISIWFSPPSWVHGGLHVPASLPTSGDRVWFGPVLLWLMRYMRVSSEPKHRPYRQVFMVGPLHLVLRCQRHQARLPCNTELLQWSQSPRRCPDPQWTLQK